MERKIKLIPLADILKKVEAKKAEGKNEKWFFNSDLTLLDYKELINQGYKITAGYVNGCPNFKVSW